MTFPLSKPSSERSLLWLIASNIKNQEEKKGLMYGCLFSILLQPEQYQY